MLTLLGAASRRARVAGLAALALAAGVVVSASNGASAQEVTAVEGSAYGYFCDVTAFGQACEPPGPAPEVTLPPGGSATPITATQESASVFAGPAAVFSSGPLTVSTQGTTGEGGSVTSSANIENVNASGQEVFTAASVTSECTANASGVSGSTTITGGRLQVDSGDSNPNNDIPDHPAEFVDIPTNPDPNTTYEGHVHVGNATDNFTYIFNEQQVTDGSLIVYAAHQIFEGPLTSGNLFIGKSECGVTATQETTTTTEQQTTTTTEQQPTTTTTEQQPTTTTTEQQPTTTTTEQQPTTTTTGPTTTTTGPTTTTTGPTTTTTARDGEECKPGYGYGDPNHCHSGPPGLENRPTTTRPRPRR